MKRLFDSVCLTSTISNVRNPLTVDHKGIARDPYCSVLVVLSIQIEDAWRPDEQVIDVCATLTHGD